MTTKVVPGMLVATPDAATHGAEAGARISRTLREAITKRGRATLALSGGTTPQSAYAHLAGDKRIDWERVHVVWVDDRAVTADSPRSNYGAAKKVLLDPVGIPADNVHPMDGAAKDLNGAARAYEITLASLVGGQGGVPVLDVAILGVGDDGHTASLFPGSPEVHERERLVVAVPKTEDREARLTLTAPVLEGARALFVLAIGKSKAEPLERVWSVEGNLDETPARLLRNARGSIMWIIDRAAGGLG